MGPWAHAGALVRIVFQARGVGRALRFGRRPPLRFGVLLLRGGAFLFPLLEGSVRFFLPSSSSLQCTLPRCWTHAGPRRGGGLARVGGAPRLMRATHLLVPVVICGA